jgi:predicted polyphosphate/ATP-dependent NAD kinase
LKRRRPQTVTANTTAATVGLIVNPIAGIGGSVGLKGTDGPEVLEEALQRGGRPVSPERCIRALNSLKQNISPLKVVTCPGEMGEKEAITSSVPYDLLSISISKKTSAADTRTAAKQLEGRRVKLLLFAGGDGTARDLSKAVDGRIAVLGIPCGVKNYSSVFATSPEAAGEVAASYLRDEITAVDAEVLDFDEKSLRMGRIETRICGVLRVPSSRRFMQNAKSTYALNDESDKEAIAKFVVEEMKPEFQYILGPGSTAAKVAERLGVEKTLLGVDVISGGKVVAKDLTDRELNEIVRKKPTKLIIAPIGGQGYILGRGNQQLTPSLIRGIGKENVTIICSRSKLTNLSARRFLVDTGDRSLDSELVGYWRIVVGYREFAIVKVEK